MEEIFRNPNTVSYLCMLVAVLRDFSGFTFSSYRFSSYRFSSYRFQPPNFPEVGRVILSLPTVSLLAVTGSEFSGFTFSSYRFRVPGGLG